MAELTESQGTPLLTWCIVVDCAAARVNDEHILDAVGELEGGAVSAEVLLLVAKAEDLDHGGRDHLQGLIGVGRLFIGTPSARAKASKKPAEPLARKGGGLRQVPRGQAV